jgi:hypothetical protein
MIDFQQKCATEFPPTFNMTEFQRLAVIKDPLDISNNLPMPLSNFAQTC